MPIAGTIQIDLYLQGILLWCISEALHWSPIAGGEKTKKRGSKQ